MELRCTGRTHRRRRGGGEGRRRLDGLWLPLGEQGRRQRLPAHGQPWLRSRLQVRLERREDGLVLGRYDGVQPFGEPRHLL